MRVRCYDVVLSVTDAATERFGVLLRENVARKEGLARFCEGMDRLAAQLEAEIFEVSVDEDTTALTVTMVCPAFEIDSRDSLFYGLAAGARQLGLRPSSDNPEWVCVDFVLDGIWERNPDAFKDLPRLL